MFGTRPAVVAENWNGNMGYKRCMVTTEELEIEVYCRQ